jgi:predicted neutral ceramidase superfamily lipid hydrolase
MQPKLKKSMFWIVLAGLVNIIFVLLGTLRVINDAAVIIIVGVFSFFSMLALSSYFSEKESLMQGELRKAIATSLIMVYFTILAMAVVEPGVNVLSLSLAAEDESVSPKIFLLKDFSALIAVVVGFYFGGRSAEEIIKTWKGKEQETNSDEGLG